MVKNSKLSALIALVEAEQSTTKLAKSATQLVWDKNGNCNADIMFVGEAPGKKEDETGLPFQGASGRILDELLTSIGLDRKDTYITNIVKYRPDKNRDPSKAEKQVFNLYLREEIAIINPKLIVFLGRHSMNEFLPGLAISEVHGRVFSRELHAEDDKTQKFNMLPLYHPAAALYNGSLRSTLFEDFKVITGFTENSKRDIT